MLVTLEVSQEKMSPSNDVASWKHHVQAITIWGNNYIGP